MLPGGNRLSGMPHRSSSRQSNTGCPASCGGTLMLVGAAPFNSRTATSAVRASELVDGHQRSADDSGAEVHAVPRKQGRIGPGVEVGEHPLVRIRGPRRVRAERHIEDRRVVWQARTAAQDLRKGQIVEPDKCQPVVKSPELRPRARDARTGRFVRIPSPRTPAWSGAAAAGCRR